MNKLFHASLHFAFIKKIKLFMNHRHKKIVIHIGQGIFLIMINLLIFMGGQCIKNVRNN